MLRISKMTDYALVVMSLLAKKPDTVLSASIIASLSRLAQPTVSKILKILADANLVQSVRGVEGGYHLSKPADQITVLDIIAAMEGDLALTVCCETTNLCTLDTVCTLKGNWRKINDMMLGLLHQFTINDMLAPLSIKGLDHGK